MVYRLVNIELEGFIVGLPGFTTLAGCIVLVTREDGWSAVPMVAYFIVVMCPVVFGGAVFMLLLGLPFLVADTLLLVAGNRT